MTHADLETFFTHYLACALWSSTDADGDGLDAIHDADDIPDHVKANLRAECADFIAANAADLAGLSAEQAGHDFWLTRNGHGAGFWDRGLGELGDRLSDACEPYGSVDLYVGDDGKVWAMGYEVAK